MQVADKFWDEVMTALSKSIAVYELLHAHAAGETDLTEDQLANVVTEIADGSRDVLARMRARSGPVVWADGG